MKIKTDFKSIIEKYIEHFRDITLAEIEWFRSRPSLCVAIEVAALAQDENHKRYFHQRLIPCKALDKSLAILTNLEKEIENCPNFHALWLLIVDRIQPIHGIGELYCYDTAFRIGAYRGVFPEKVYLHRGTRVGAKTLLPDLDPNAQFIELLSLPEQFKILPPYEIEDILCIYEKELRIAIKSIPK